MRQTLFFIPHELAGLPVFGLGWLLLLWVLFCLVLLVRLVRRQGWNNDVWGILPVLVLIAVAIGWIVPRIEEPIPAGHLVLPPVAAEYGLPIRGYGVMLLLGVTAGVGLAVRRAVRVGLSPDVIYNLAFCLFLGGILGARLFYVIQYWPQMQGPTLTATLANVLNLVGGGLVVYGSLIGAMVAFGWFVWRYRLPALALADLIAPSLLVGLALGRIGCLMNGCCFGAVSPHPWAVTFPQQSPPYMYQHGLGLPYGFRLDENSQGVLVGQVEDDGPAAQAGLVAGQHIASINGVQVRSLPHAHQLLAQSGAEIALQLETGPSLRIGLPALPARSLPVHPTQIYSAINATLLCLFLLAFWPFRRRDGQVIAWALTLYALTRFLIEIIRTDEGGFWTTGLTISQNVSLMMLVLVAFLWFYIWQRPAGLTWNGSRS